MDDRTRKKLTEIGIKASRDAKRRGMRVERPFANMAEDMRYVARTSPSLEERQTAAKYADEMENNPLLRKTLEKTEMVIDEEYNAEVSRRTEKMIQEAIARGEMADPRKTDYNEFMKRVHKK